MMTKYDYYKDAAERHLETCKELRGYIKNNFYGLDRPLTFAEERKQKMILANIYYLSGYVIECIVNYGILKHIRFEQTNKYVNQLSTLDNANGVTYSHLQNAKYCIYQKDHSLFVGNSKLHYFKHEAKIQSIEIDKIPFINTKTHQNPEQEILIRKWGAKIRYEIQDALLLAPHILGFQTNSEKIYTGLSNHIIPKL